MLSEDPSEDANGEGVWSADIEQAFKEACEMYPTCGRRKIIVQDPDAGNHKMFGRNELIARYIYMRTGHTRSRKQVSSHIQVLARRRTREVTVHRSDTNGGITDKTNGHHVSAQLDTNGQFNNGLNGINNNGNNNNNRTNGTLSNNALLINNNNNNNGTMSNLWEHHLIATHRIRLVEFCAYIESQSAQLKLQQQQALPSMSPQHSFVHINHHTLSSTDPKLETVDIKEIYDKFPGKEEGGLHDLYERGPQNAFFLVKFWADINTLAIDEPNSFYGFSSQFVSPLKMSLTCSTKVCSFGKGVVEKVELVELDKYSHSPEYVYRIKRSPMCDYMKQFIEKLSKLPEIYMMNSVLENFTILQVISNKETGETLLCTAYVFEVSSTHNRAQHHIYRLR